MRTRTFQNHGKEAQRLWILATFALLTLPILAAPASAGGGILWDQTDNPAVSGVPDQNYDSSINFLDSEAADDFMVDAASGWQVERVNTIGTTGVPGQSTVSVTFYSDNGGTPLGGGVECSYTGIVPTDDDGDLGIDLPSPCDLSTGVYWVAIQVDQSFFNHGQHFWSNRRTQNLSTAVWRNPGGGFSATCNNWQDIVTCRVGGNPGPPQGPDLLFQLVGQVNP
jgi:hypothetical protein